jgi:hypothetical protein
LPPGHWSRAWRFCRLQRVTWFSSTRERSTLSGRDRYCWRPSRTATRPTGCSTTAVPRELHVAKALEAIRLETNAGKVPPVDWLTGRCWWTASISAWRRSVVDGTRSGDSMRGADALDRSGPLRGRGCISFRAAEPGTALQLAWSGKFDPVDCPAGQWRVPASSPAWQIEDLGGLELIRITPRWPEGELA